MRAPRPFLDAPAPAADRRHDARSEGVPQTRARRIGRGIAVGLCALACVVALALHTERVSAANLAVTNCLDDSSAGSLRVVIGAAGSGDIIGFNQDCTGAGAITLGSTLTLTRNVTVDGVGHNVTVQAAATPNTATYRVFTINSGVVNISNLTIANGHTVGGLGQEGGGIQNNGTLTVTNSTLSGNRAFRPGGGIYNASGGMLTVTNSTLSGNYALLGGGGIENLGMVTVTNSTLSGNLVSKLSVPDGGGGIENFGTVTMTSSTLSGNSAPVGGGILNNGGATATVTNSTLSGNSATGGPGQPGDGNGGGIQNFGTLTVTNSTLSGNSASGIGGGIDNASSLNLVTGTATTGMLTMTNSTFSGNTATFDGGGIFNNGTMTVTNGTFSGNSATGGSGGGISNVANPPGGGVSLAVTNSTFNDNSATGGPGGGIYNLGGTMTVTNSTLARNSTSGFDGGGIYNYNGTVTVTNSTLSGNSASGNGGGISNNIFNTRRGMLTVTNSTLSGNSASAGGGIENGGTLNLTNTIVAGNTAPPSPDIGGAVASNGHNLIGNTSGGSGFVASDLQNVSPLLGPLASYGGPTQTLALLPGSPALGGGTAGAGIPTTDQRGVARTGHNDIGAFQSQGFTLTLAAGNTQSVPVTTAFSPLTVSVSAIQAGAPFNEPVDGGRVSFVGPGSGAGIQVSPAIATISSGQASITPSANGVAGGPYAVTATITASGTPSVVFSLTNTAPTITLAPTTLPTGTVGVAYSQTLTASGGMAPYAFTVATGSLPTGLTLAATGALSGTPTAAGSATFTVTATDAIGFTGTRQYTLTIAAAGPTLTGIALTGPNSTPPPAALKVGQRVQLTATGTYSDGSTANITTQVQWSSSNAAIATVDAAGIVTGQSPGGPVTITATLKGVSGTTTVSVTPPTPLGIQPAPAPAARPAGAASSVPPGAPAVPAPAPLPPGR